MDSPFDEEQARRLITDALEGQLGDGWEIADLETRSLIPHPADSWEFTARKPYPGAYGAGEERSGVLSPDGAVDLQ